MKTNSARQPNECKSSRFKDLEISKDPKAGQTRKNQARRMIRKAGEGQKE